MFTKILSVLRIVLTHLYVWIALYLATVFVVNTVRHYEFLDGYALPAFYKLFMHS